MKKLGGKLLAIVCAIVAIVLFFTTMNWDLKHIEDTNGPDNYALTTITEEDIVAREMGSLTPYTKKEAMFGNGITLRSKKFTGVCELFYSHLLGKSDVHMELYDFEVKEGNFVLAVINDGEIVATPQPDEFGRVLIHLEDLTGDVAVVMAGESANYTFSISQLDYERMSSRIN